MFRLSGVIIGRGDYKITHNSVFSGSTSAAPPSFSNGSQTRVRHREFIQDIYSGVIPVTVPPAAEGVTTPFLNAAPGPHYKHPSDPSKILGPGFILNPGCTSTFPWLSGIANNFQKYQWMGLVFEFITSSGDALTSKNTALGSVIMATDYDTNHIPFTDKRLMENSDYANSGKPSISQIHGIECDPSINPLNCSYIRPDYPEERDNPLAVVDRRFSDHGRFQIATIGMQGQNQIVGELWATYDVILMCPDQDVDPVTAVECGNLPGAASYCPSYSICGGTDPGNIVCDTGMLAPAVWNRNSFEWDSLATPEGLITDGTPIGRAVRSVDDCTAYQVTNKFLLPGTPGYDPLWNTTLNDDMHVFDWTMCHVNAEQFTLGYNGVCMPNLDGRDVPLSARVPDQSAAYFRVTFRWEYVGLQGLLPPEHRRDINRIVGPDPATGGYLASGVQLFIRNVLRHNHSRPTFYSDGAENYSNQAARMQDVSYGVAKMNGGMTPVVSHMQVIMDIAIPYDKSQRVNDIPLRIVVPDLDPCAETPEHEVTLYNCPTVYIPGDENADITNFFKSIVDPAIAVAKSGVTFRFKSQVISKAEYYLDNRSAGGRYVDPLYVDVASNFISFPIPNDNTNEDVACVCSCASAQCKC